MSTSDPPTGAFGVVPSQTLASGDLSGEIARLANELFLKFPGALAAPAQAPSLSPASAPSLPVPSPGILVPPSPAPHAGAAGPGGGASSSQTFPPLPGALHQPPLAAAPPPTESDLRNVPTTVAGGLPSGLPLSLVGGEAPPASLLSGWSPGSPPSSALSLSPLSLSPLSSSPPSSSPPSSPPSAPASSFLSASPFSTPWSLASPANFSELGAPSYALPLSLVPDGAPSKEGAPYFLELGGHSAPAGAVPSATSLSERALPSYALPLSLVGDAEPSAQVAPYFLDLGGYPSPAGAAVPATPPAEAKAGQAPARPESGRGFSASPGIFDAASIKRDFPILRERVHGRPIVWLDNAATTQKPQAVIDRLSYFYEHENSNVHRAAHTLAARATDAYESARDKVRSFLGAPSSKDIVFVRGTTEAINLVAKSWGRRNVAAGDEIVITWLEHHANIVPWQQLVAETGARLRVAPVDDRGQVRLDEFERLLGPRTRLVSMSQVSNALGTIVPVAEMIKMAHRHGARVMVDGAQSVSHLAVDVQALDCDFFCFSGHKIFGPTGIGALYGKTELLETMPPWQGGGNMISDVTFEKTTFHPPPNRFEAGTGNIADAVGLGAALDYVRALGLENISRYEHDLLVYATGELARVPGLRMIGTAAEKAGVLSFVMDGLRTEDIGRALDQEGIAVRSGHHCAQPILRRFGVESTVRASLAPYNTCEDIDALVDTLLRLRGNLQVA